MYGEPMKIQIGSIYINRTRKYLFPIIKSYGKEFTDKINNLNKLGVGIGDIVTNKCGIHHEKHLFILVDTTHDVSNFFKILQYMQNHVSYEDDYAFDAIHKGKLHMLVIQIPDEFIQSIKSFKEGEFSKMYTLQQIRDLFTYSGSNVKTAEEYQNIQKVLIHDHNYAIQFAKQIEKEFFTEYKPSDLKVNQEFDFPILIQEEFFNFKP